MTQIVTRTPLAFGLAAGLVALSTMAASATPSNEAATSPASSTPASVLAFDQKLQGNELTLDYAYLPQKGYAVVYGSDKNGKPIREPLGHAELNAGDHRGVKIKLNSTPAPGTKLWVSLYSDKDQKAGFNRSADASMWGDKLPSENGIVVR